ncbi:sulfite exporter TauE/SafE family protein [Arvimicrobium flavum]|uniref:sulfite exporter TauE/SafE family protein n=1 Tax=Arvimicrobium flavum TaxID=3393320 RepID=UPI00237BA178|nr:sulfite exporter TauE/SafE family protein [Mesorhizobium shangrilense]
MIDGIDLETLLWLAGMLVFGGAVTGILAGLFGVGGGAITVPVLFEVFGVLGIEDEVRMPLAVGTSLAIIIPTSFRSFRGHYRKGAVDTGILRKWAVPIILGVLLGSVIARYATPAVFQGAFVIVGGITVTKLLFGRESWRLAEQLPSGNILRLYGMVVGLLSALMGIGGGALSTLVLTLHGRPIHQAVATSSGVGMLISIPGALGYVAAGWGRAGLPPDALGFVSLLGCALVIPTAFLTTQIGVNLAHSMSRRKLEILFGLFILTVCVRFLLAMVM